MSFGYSVGDILHVIELTHKLCKRFAQAPEEFLAVSNQVTSLSNVLQDVDAMTRLVELTDWQKSALALNIGGCHSALERLGRIVDKNSCLKGSVSSSVKNRSIRVLKRATLDDVEIHNVCSHINFQVSTLSCFLLSLNNKVSHLTTVSIRNIEGGVDDAQAGIKALESRVDDARSSVVHVQTGVDTVQTDVHKTLSRMNKLQASIEELQVSIQKQREQETIRHDRNETDTILFWLSHIDFADQQTDLLRRREPGTGEWLLVSSKYEFWIRSGRQTLFCPGFPGAGKTFIASLVIDNLHKRFQEDSTVATAYIFYNFRSKHEQVPEDLLLCLTKQIIRGRPIPDELKKLYEYHNRRQTRPSLNDISATLRSVCALFTNVFIVIDALDECGTENRDKFLFELFNLQKTAPMNIFATSRMIPEIESWFTDHEQLEIRATTSDIEKYLETQITRLPSFFRKLQDEIKVEISKVVDGMFLLAQLYVNSLEGKRSIKAVRTALKNLRGCDTYDALYSSAIERIEDQIQDARELAKQVISWIAWARRPISATELQYALGIELGSSAFDEENLPDIDYMISVCAGLVTVDHGSRVIRLVHYTMQEYLERKWRDQATSFEVDMTVTCVTLLSFSDFGTGTCKTEKEFESRLQTYPFYDYSARHWGHHARMGRVLDDLVYVFLRDEKKVEAAAQVLAASKEVNSQKKPGTTTGLHLAAHFGLHEAVRVLLSDGWLPDSRDSYFRTPLSWASREGHQDVVRLLLKNEVDVSSRDYLGRTPLCYACRRGCKAIVEELLDNKVHADVKDNMGRSPLSWAAENGHMSVVECLLASGKVLADSSNEFGITPLSWAAREGHIGIVNLLLQMGASPNSIDKRGESPLAYATRRRDESIIQLLLQRGADPNFIYEDGWTGLSLAAKEGNQAIVRLLLRADGIDPNVKSPEGNTPLSCAAEMGHLSVVQLLIDDPRVELDAKDGNGWTALMEAADEGFEGVVALLLMKASVDVNSRNSWNQTPLSRAARNGHVAVVRLLLCREETEANSPDTSGWTPLIQAVRHGHNCVVEEILEKGNVDLLSTDFTGRTALSWAAGQGYETLVDCLLWRLEAGRASLDCQDHVGRTPLFWAAVNDHAAVVESLLRAGAMTTVGDCWGKRR